MVGAWLAKDRERNGWVSFDCWISPLFTEIFESLLAAIPVVAVLARWGASESFTITPF